MRLRLKDNLLRWWHCLFLLGELVREAVGEECFALLSRLMMAFRRVGHSLLLPGNADFVIRIIELHHTLASGKSIIR